MIKDVRPNLDVAPRGRCRLCGAELVGRKAIIGFAPKQGGGGCPEFDAYGDRLPADPSSRAVWATLWECPEHGENMEGAAAGYVAPWMREIWVSRWQIAMREAEDQGWTLVPGQELNGDGVPYFVAGGLIPALQYEDGTKFVPKFVSERAQQLRERPAGREEGDDE